MRNGFEVAFAVACLVVSTARAQIPTVSTPATQSPAPQTSAPPTSCCVIQAGVPVEIELTEALSSKTAEPDQMFGVKLVRDIVVDGQVLAPKGAIGMGQVVDVGHAGFSGRPGKLILAARYLKVGGQRLPLRSFKLSGAGHDDSKTIGLLSASVPLLILATGGEIEFPAGTRAFAKIASDTLMPPIAPASADPARPPVTPTPSPQKDQTP